MIDAKRWIVAEAWLANGLRLRWGDIRHAERRAWIEDTDARGVQYRYTGFGEWEVAGSGYTSAGYTRPEAPSLSTETMLHELAHWLTATSEQRDRPNFGMSEDGTSNRDQEERCLEAERVIESIASAASRIVNIATGAGK